MGIASLAGLVLTRAQYTALADHCQHDPGFPDWPAWNKLQIQAASVFLRHNKPVALWRLDVDDFIAWCAETGHAPSVEALQTYADGRALSEAK